MKQFLLVFLMLFVFCFNQNVEAAQELHVMQNYTITFALKADKGLDGITNLLTSQVKADLNNEGFEAIFISAEDEPTDYDESFGFDQASKANMNLNIQQYNDNIHIALFPHTSPMPSVSPILEERYAKSSTFVFEKNNTNQTIAFGNVVKFASILALYSVGKCNQVQEEIPRLEEALGNPTNAFQDWLLKSIHFYRGNCYLVVKDHTNAITEFKNSLLYDSALRGETGPLVGSAVNLAWTYIQLGDKQKAITLMDQLVNDIESLGAGFGIEPMQVNRYVQRAEIYNLLGRYSDAITDLTSALDTGWIQGSLKAHYYVKRGQTYLLLYEWDKVAADYNKALELDPTYADAYFYRGVLYYSILQTGQAMYTDALADFQRYLELAPDGEHAAEATRYATDIQTQINALNN